MKRVKRYFINNIEVSLEKFKNHYKVVLDIWFLVNGGDSETSFDTEVYYMFDCALGFNSKSTKMYGIEFKITNELEVKS